MNAAPPRIRLCTIAEIAPGEAVKVQAGGLTLAVFNVEGRIHVTDDACTHGPGSLSEGYLEGEVIECNFHQGCFNVRTGEVVTPPCIVPIKTYTSLIEDGVVYVVV
jgi:nitrite reductase/ring-hydroxylating ferredoxin subunit